MQHQVYTFFLYHNTQKLQTAKARADRRFNRIQKQNAKQVEKKYVAEGAKAFLLEFIFWTKYIYIVHIRKFCVLLLTNVYFAFVITIYVHIWKDATSCFFLFCIKNQLYYILHESWDDFSYSNFGLGLRLLRHNEWYITMYIQHKWQNDMCINV